MSKRTEEMKLDEILYEIASLDWSRLTNNERKAICAAIPMLERGEKYRKALLKINDTKDQEKISRIIEEAFDCEVES